MKKKEYKIIKSRAYKYLSTHSYYSFRCKESDKAIEIELTNNGGVICFELLDLTNGKTTKYDNPNSGFLIFDLEVDHKYQLLINSKSAIGSYKIKIKRCI